MQRIDLVREAAVAFAACSRAVGNDVDELVRPSRLTPPLAELLWNLDPRCDPPAMKDLAVALRCDRSNVTTLVERLVALGLVTRSEDTFNRRSKVVTLTAAGRVTRAATMGGLAEQSAFAALTDSELVELARLLALLGS
ncbi:MarR family winged helix-turn-helix transcriptional regulator [Cellulomonas sp. URHD0024]|uniref:MarR family winged helix-turn-helix transcriptional regulator n=1 Tax=Cellulomonas sp. URHD0024 TaxID=1302620 RepID=UPI00041826AC|nr:MarR family winged helix-turn-helix transcriptional regulator [Cellulomonas sp. URHD0024]